MFNSLKSQMNLFFFLSMAFVIFSCSFLACSPANPSQEKTTEKIQHPDNSEGLMDTVSDAAPLDIVPLESPSEEEPTEEKPSLITQGALVRIAHVIDGDTLYVVTKLGGWAHRIRLLGINAPECHKQKKGAFESCVSDDEIYGLQAYYTLKKMADKLHGKRLTIFCTVDEVKKTCITDKFGRFLAYLQSPIDKKFLGQKVLEAGAAWTFTSFRTRQMKLYCRTEALAIKNKVGMWQKGRAAVKRGMSSKTQNWYKNHDKICSKALGESFAKLAGER